MRTALLALGFLVSTGLLCAKSGLARPRPLRTHRGEVRCLGPGRVLPAGQYFLSSGKNIGVELGCPRPRTALLLGVFHKVEDVEKAIRALPSNAITLAYPWVVASADFEIAEGVAPGIAVVMGLFANRRDAEAFRQSGGEWARDLTLVNLRRDEPSGWGPSHKSATVVQMGHGERQNAYWFADVLEAEKLIDYPEYRQARKVDAAAACTVEPGAVFAINPDAPGWGRFDGLAEFVWAPVLCDGRVAYVLRTSTRTESVVWLARDGHYHIAQNVVWECDDPTVDDWKYDESGRSARRLFHEGDTD
jgi:hypothetical protein